MDFMSESSGKKDTKIMGRWICFGIAIGCAIGVAIGNLALGIGPGIAAPAINLHTCPQKQLCFSAQI